MQLLIMIILHRSYAFIVSLILKIDHKIIYDSIVKIKIFQFVLDISIYFNITNILEAIVLFKK